MGDSGRGLLGGKVGEAEAEKGTPARLRMQRSLIWPEAWLELTVRQEEVFRDSSGAEKRC